MDLQGVETLIRRCRFQLQNLQVILPVNSFANHLRRAAAERAAAAPESRVFAQPFALIARHRSSFSLNPDVRMVPMGGGERSVNVTTEAGCAWTATTRENWIKLATTSGTGDGEVSYSIEQNTGAERQGTIRIGGVRQQAGR